MIAMPLYEANEISAITVTTDTSTADLFLNASIRAVAVTHQDENLIEQLVALFRVTIWPNLRITDLAKARWLAVTLSRRGAQVRWAQVDLLTTDLTTALSNEEGRERVRSLLADAPVWIDDGGEPTSDEAASDAAAGLPAFPLDVLTPTLRGLAKHFAEACDTLPTLVLPALFAAVCASFGPEWRVGARSMIRAPLLWLVLVAPPGMAKSPASRPILRPLHEEDRRLHEEYRKKRRAYALELRDWKKKKAGDRTEMPEEPQRERAVVTSVTYEGLASSLAVSPRGVAVHSDEIAQLINGFDAYQKASSPGRPFYLSLWSGERYAEGRKTSSQSEADNPFAVIFGTVQPSVMSRLRLADGDGLCARFLWLFVPRAVHGLGKDIRPDMLALWQRLLQLARTHTVRQVQCFEPAAIELLDQRMRVWSAAAQELDAAGSGLLASMYAKADDHCVRLVALLHGMDAIEHSLSDSEGHPPPLEPCAVPHVTVERAVRVVEMLLQHAAHAASLVLSRSDPTSEAGEYDEALAVALRALVPAGAEVAAEPQDWARAVSTDQRQWTPSGIGKAMARLAQSRPVGLAISRPPRANCRQWCVRRLRRASEASVASVEGAEQRPTVPAEPRPADASVASDTSSGAPTTPKLTADSQPAAANLDDACAIEAALEGAVRSGNELAVRAAHKRLAELLSLDLANAVEAELRLEWAGHAN